MNPDNNDSIQNILPINENKMQNISAQFTKYTVAVRVRPSVEGPISFTIPSKKSVTEHRPTSIVTYSFDQVFDTDQTNENIYQNSLKGFLERGLQRKLHSTVLAYGQTGSGKTHTLFGHESNGLIHCIGRELFHEEQTYKITCSVLQIYNEKITDLVTNNEIRLMDDSKGNTIIEGLQITQIKSFSQFQSFLKSITKNKIFGNSYIHNQSSRSHVLLTLRINGNHINIVDLCGSEVLTYNFNEKQRQETNNINLSLFTLNSVLAEICDNRNKHIPYRNSVLTRLLKNSLSPQNTCQIYMICTIAPETEHLEMSRKTLRFGQLAIQIDDNGVKEQVVNLSEQKRQSKKVKNIVDQKLELEEYEFTGFKWKIETIVIGGENVQIYKMNWQQPGKDIFVFLHAYGYYCDGTDWNVFIDKILKKFPKVKMLSLDFPGFGKSGGKKFTSRSEKFGEKGQPIEFMKILFAMLKIASPKSLTMFGYDLGGAIALSSCLDPALSKLIQNVICFHPTWTDSVQSLAPVTQRVLLLWMNVQTFHLVAAGQKMSKTIKNSTLYRFNIGVYSDEKAEGFYHRYSKAMCSVMCQFISQSPNCTLTIEKEKKVSDRGKVIETIIINPLTKEEEERAKSLESIKQYFSLIQNNTHKSVYESLLRTNENTPKYTRLAGNLFALTPTNLTFDVLFELGLIKSAFRSAEVLKQYPMYCPGRQLQIKTTVQLNMLEEGYLKYSEKGDIAATHYAFVSPSQTEEKIKATQKILVNVLSIDNKFKQIELELKKVVELNEETPFTIVNGDYIFEDSVTCKYSSLFMKLKMYECLFHTKQLIDRLDYVKNQQELLKLQQQIAKRVVRQIDLRHLVHEGIDNTRYTGTDVGKLAYKGQGNCHHLASVGAALLLPFGKLCGWDVIFRAGSCLKSGREIDNEGKPLPDWNGKPKINVEDHTWLQIVFKPSLSVFVFDPSFNLQNYQLDEMYGPLQFHISGKPQCVYGERQLTIPKQLFDSNRSALK